MNAARRHRWLAAALGSALAGNVLAAGQATASADRPDWQVSIGPGLNLSPVYPGARRTLVYAVPYQDIDYRGRFFSNGFDVLGVYARNDATWQIGADLQYDPTWRHRSDDARLSGLKDIDATARARVFAQATYAFLTLSVDAAQDVAGQRQGLVADADLYASVPLGKKALLSFGTGLTWADRRYMRTFFGILPAQAAQSAFPVYALGGGLRDRHASAIATYTLSDRWQALCSATWARLHGEAADSPIVERRGQLDVSAALKYRFR